LTSLRRVGMRILSIPLILLADVGCSIGNLMWQIVCKGVFSHGRAQYMESRIRILYRGRLCCLPGIYLGVEENIGSRQIESRESDRRMIRH
jgi:hypothetical protein